MRVFFFFFRFKKAVEIISMAEQIGVFRTANSIINLKNNTHMVVMYFTFRIK